MNEEKKPEFVKIDPPEKSRTYRFSGGSVTFTNVTHVCVRPSGTHRLQTADGKKHIVSIGWLSIELDIENWTF